MFSPEYKALQERFHVERPEYGISGSKYADFVANIADKLGTRDILDYGAGKGTLQKSLPYPIQNYDPFIPEFNARPRPAVLVTCTDVMEHIEAEFLRDVLKDIQSLAKGAVFFQIATGPARKFLPDGRNAHLIQEGVNWWVSLLMEYWDLQNLNNQGNGFISIWTPKQEQPKC